MVRHRLIGAGMVGLVLIAAIGCAGSGYMQGRALIRQGRYAEAIEVLERAAGQRPADVAVWTQLGIACYRNDELDRAAAALSRARGLDPANAKAVLYLGMAYERMGAYDRAVDTYKQYTRFSRLVSIRRQIEGRLQVLMRERIRQSVVQALKLEAQIDPASIPDHTIAVTYFRNAGTNTELDPLQKGLTHMLITDLSKVTRLKVIERVRVQALMEEMGLGTTGLLDQATAPRAGKLLGVARVLTGAFCDLEGDGLRIDAAASLTKAVQPPQPQTVSGPLDSFFALEKDLAFSIIEHMGITLTKAERDAIEEVPTENLMAFLAYARGLDLEDRGRHQEAQEAYRRAVDLDADFQEAVRACEAMLEAKQVSLERLELAVADATREQDLREEEVALTAVSVRAQETADQSTPNFAIHASLRALEVAPVEADLPTPQPQPKTEAQVEVEGALPTP